MKLFESKFKEFISEAYKPGDTIDISGTITGDLKDSNDNPVDIPDEERNFSVNIPGNSILNTEIYFDPSDVSTMGDFFKSKKLNSNAPAITQLKELGSTSFARKYLAEAIPGYLEAITNIENKKWNKKNPDKEPKKFIDLKGLDEKDLRNDIKDMFYTLKKEGLYKQEVIKDLNSLLSGPFEVFIKVIERLGLVNTEDNNPLWMSFFRPGVDMDTKFLPFESPMFGRGSNNKNKNKPGVYFYTVNDSDPVYVGKSSKFSTEFNGYKKGNASSQQIYNNSTRGRINSEIAKKVAERPNGEPIDIKWYNIPVDNNDDISKYTNVLKNLESKNVDIKKSFPNKNNKGKVSYKSNPHLDFLETVLMSKITGEKWNKQGGGFKDYIKINE